MVTAGKARRFSEPDDERVGTRRNLEALYGENRGNDNLLGAQPFSGQEGFTTITQSGIGDPTKVRVEGSQFSGAVGWVQRLCELNTATKVLDITKDTSGVIFPQVPGDVIVALSAGFVADLEIINFPKFNGHRLRLYGISGNTITVIHTGGATLNAIKCPDDVNFTWNDDEVIDFVYNVVTSQWHLMKGVTVGGGAGSFANQTLSNLTPNLVRVNTDLEPGVTATHSLGTTLLNWLDLWLSGVAFIGAFNAVGIGGAGGDFNANFWDMDAIVAPADPPTGTRRVFVDTNNNDELSVKKFGGGIVSLEAGAGAGFANTALSNLVGVSINADLIPQVNLDLGSTVAPWDELHVGLIDFDTTGVKDGFKHQIIRDSPNNNMVFNVPIAEAYEWCETGIPHMSLDFAELELSGTGAGLVLLGGVSNPFIKFVNPASPGFDGTLTGLTTYRGFNSIFLERTFAETNSELVSNLSGQETGSFVIRSTSVGIQGSLTYEQNFDTFSFSHFGADNQPLFFNIVHDPISVNPGPLDIIFQLRGQNSLGVLQNMVRFEALFQDRTSGSEDVKFDIQVQRNSAVQSFMDFNDSGNNKIRFKKDIDVGANAIIVDADGDSRFISPVDDILNLELQANIEYTFAPGAFLFGNVTGAYLEARDLLEPSTPGSNRGRIFLDSVDNILKIKHDDSTVKSLEASGAGSQTPWLSNINADGKELFNISRIKGQDTGFDSFRIVFDANEDSDTYITDGFGTDTMAFFANASSKMLINNLGVLVSSPLSLSSIVAGDARIFFEGENPANIPTPGATDAFLFVNENAGSPLGQISVKKSDGSVVSLEGGGAGGDLWSDPVDANIIPDGTNNRDLGSFTNEFRNIHSTGIIFSDEIQLLGDFTQNFGTVTFSGTVNLAGSVTNINSNTINLGNSTGDEILFKGEVDSNIIPNGTNNFDLGSASKQWRNIFITGLADIDEIFVSGLSEFNGKVTTGGEIEINGNLNHDGSRIGFYAKTPVVKPTVFDIPVGSSLSSVISIVNILYASLGSTGAGVGLLNVL